MDELIEDLIDEIETLKTQSPNKYHVEGYHGCCAYCKESMLDVGRDLVCLDETEKEKGRIRIKLTDLHKLKDLLLAKLTIEDRKFMYEFIHID